jgi:hypothetical protein
MIKNEYLPLIILLFFVMSALSQVSSTGKYQEYIRQPTLLSHDAFHNIPPPRLHDKNDRLLKPFHFAKSIPISVIFDYSSIAMINAQGDWRWKIKIASVDAISLSLIFDQWWIPEYSEVYVYNNEVINSELGRACV